MAPHSSTHAWRIPWTEEPGGLQSMGSRRVKHDKATSLSVFTSLLCFGEGNGNPLQCSCLENPRDGGAWWAAVYGVAQSRTRLKRLSSSSRSSTSRLRPTATQHEGRRQAWLSVKCEPLSCSSQLFPNLAGTLGSFVGASEPPVQPRDEEIGKNSPSPGG